MKGDCKVLNHNNLYTKQNESADSHNPYGPILNLVKGKLTTVLAKTKTVNVKEEKLYK